MAEFKARVWYDTENGKSRRKIVHITGKSAKECYNKLKNENGVFAIDYFEEVTSKDKGDEGYINN